VQIDFYELLAFIWYTIQRRISEHRNLMFLVMRSSYCFDRLQHPYHFALQSKTVFYNCLWGKTIASSQLRAVRSRPYAL